MDCELYPLFLIVSSIVYCILQFFPNQEKESLYSYVIFFNPSILVHPSTFRSIYLCCLNTGQVICHNPFLADTNTRLTKAFPHVTFINYTK